MKTFTLEDNEATFVIEVIGQLPTKSGAMPVFNKLAEQYNAQLPPSEPPQE
jgi:hypothetical protein